MTQEKISLQPARPEDFHTLAQLECDVFWTEEFSMVAFGPLRGEESSIALRASSMAKESSSSNIRSSYVKAVIVDGKGEEEIVGMAGWTFYFWREDQSKKVGREGEAEEDNGQDEEGAEVNGKEEEKEGWENGNGGEGEEQEEPVKELSEEERKKINEGVWGKGANFRFCEDAFCVADDHMLRSTEGKNYAKLSTLVISPSHQRRGIGSMLLEAGLREVDSFGLQCVLAASPEGEGLYKRFGFTEFEVMTLNLWEYAGGEGLGPARHCVMHRPVQSKGSKYFVN